MDEKALEAAARAAYEDFSARENARERLDPFSKKKAPWHELTDTGRQAIIADTKAAIKAYLAAAPGEYGDLVERLREKTFRASWCIEAATAIATLSAKLAAETRRADEAWRMIDATYDAVSEHWFLDPPDGGDVKMYEGVRRIEHALQASEAKVAELARECVTAEARTPDAKTDMATCSEVLADTRASVSYWRTRAEAAEAREAKLREAGCKALNYITNTENELGMTLDCGDALRAALSSPAPAQGQTE